MCIVHKFNNIQTHSKVTKVYKIPIAIYDKFFKHLQLFLFKLTLHITLFCNISFWQDKWLVSLNCEVELSFILAQAFRKWKLKLDVLQSIFIDSNGPSIVFSSTEVEFFRIYLKQAKMRRKIKTGKLTYTLRQLWKENANN